MAVKNNYRKPSGIKRKLSKLYTVDFADTTEEQMPGSFWGENVVFPGTPLFRVNASEFL